MDFLKREFEGLPDAIVETGLAQLERVLREIKVQEPGQLSLTAVEQCAKLKAVMDFLACFRRASQNTTAGDAQ